MKIFGLFLISLLTTSLFAQTSEPNIQLSKRIANYDISVELNTETKVLNGKEVLFWQNPSNDRIHSLQFHLYMNAFKNSKSSFSNEGGNRGTNTDILKKDEWGYININSFKLEDGTDLTDKIKFIQPDDGNKDDQTVVEVELIKPILPKKSLKIEIEFETKLPKIVARTGYAKDYFLVGQWFPKIGVYEPAGMRYSLEGAWNCHQFHANSEFYANFGNYQVDITLPQKFVVGATGTLVKESTDSNNNKTLTFLAEDVVDFAWTASPNFVVYNSVWKDVQIKLMSMPNLKDHFARNLKSLVYALEYFENALGKYPYPSITVVSPPNGASASGGMEYPMFITTFDFWGIPDSVRLVESTTIHEFGHQYFMGILASNEFEEAWQDEGFNTYYEGKIMDHYYSPGAMLHLGGISVGGAEMHRLSYVGSKFNGRAEIARKSWEYNHGGYGTMTYSKTALWMHTLEGIVGKSTMEKIMKTYYQRWKFDHPNQMDFREVANEVVKEDYGNELGENMDWFFDQMFYSTEKCDYEIMSIRNSRLRKAEGIFENEKAEADTNGNDIYNSKVIVFRNGGIKLPNEILIHFDNNEEIIKKWDGIARTKEFSFKSPNKIEWAKIDPEFKIYADENFANNSKSFNRKSGVFVKYTQKILFYLENTILTFSMLF